MMIYAYDKEYVALAQRVMGDMLDFAVNECEMEADEYFKMFLVSGIAKQFERGNPKYVAGMTGCEVVKEVVQAVTGSVPETEDVMYIDKSPEYWVGWSLAYYQWCTARSFSRIHKAVSIEEMLYMYPTLHEADIMKFVNIMDEKLSAYYEETNLKRIRSIAKLSQKELAEMSGVSLRQIQLFEQRQRDINKAQAINLFRLSRVLGCRSEDLLEI